MQPVDFTGSNETMTLEGCNDLPVLREMRDIEGMGTVPVHVSVWELSVTDMFNILTSQKIRLTIIGSGQPPVLVEVVT